MDARGETIVAGRRAAGRGDRARPRRVGRRDADRRADQLVRERRRTSEQIGEIVERLYPGFPVTLSSEVLPEFREYERALTACMNSYVRPKVADYVDRLQEQLRRHRRDGRGQHPALGRRADDDARGGPEPDLRRALRPVGRRRRRAVRRPQGRLRRHPHLRHGRHVDRRRALPERPAHDRARDVDRPLPDQGAVRRTSTPSARAAARSRTSPS